MNIVWGSTEIHNKHISVGKIYLYLSIDFEQEQISLVLLEQTYNQQSWQLEHWTTIPSRNQNIALYQIWH